MSSHRRNLRSTTGTTSIQPISEAVASPISFAAPSSSSASSAGVIRVIAPGSKLPGLSSAELSLLRKKQKRLASNALLTLNTLPPGQRIHNALDSSLIFAQHEAGSAVCIDPEGWIVTCAHCIGETEEEWRTNRRKWLLFYTGLAVQVECRAWDPKCDLALLKIIAVESSEGTNGEVSTFHSVPLSSRAPASNMSILCIGQPGSDDLESTSDRKTGYDLVEVSQGTIRGMVPDVDPQDNSEIGTLKHDAWTYWGHSGAPLLRAVDGTLVGLHSSWDNDTAMRHGVPLVAIRHFLRQHMTRPI